MHRRMSTASVFRVLMSPPVWQAVNAISMVETIGSRGSGKEDADCAFAYLWMYRGFVTRGQEGSRRCRLGLLFECMSRVGICGWKAGVLETGRQVQLVVY